ncbi:MAG TPA: HupE/UreJ family protein, partial [Silvibacterium sp.]|nr:HupE/UreJ family protein [Silvibacterium sp.]
MKPRLIAAAACFLSLGGIASAHRLDEYLQATILSVDKDHIQASMRMIPGVAVSSSVIASIDSNGDGVISPAEQRAYAERVLGDLSLTVDGKSVKPKLVSADFPQIELMREGLGEIHIEFTADLPHGGPNRRLILENHHQRQNAAYLMNCLVPRDPDIRIVAQNRNERQSFYQLDYVQAGGSLDSPLYKWWTNVRGLISALGFASLFRLGMRHIAEGTDHLLFLLVLLLPAPLMVVGSRWAGFAGVRSSVLRILKIVTAFTIGHSITLALAAFGIVRVPSHPIEVLIAVSILVSAIHALRPIFPGKEAGIAAFFGLIHGLAFAATLSELGLGRWERVAGILAFNLGIETMQMVVVAATMPSLLLMSHTRAYPFLRIGGPLFAVFASMGWIAERLSGVRSPVDVVVGAAAHHAVWIAVGLFLISL